MKTSITLSAIILAVCTALGWYNHQEFAAVRETRARLVAEAAPLGIFVDSLHGDHPIRLTKRGKRSDKNAEARLVARDLLRASKEMGNENKSPSQATESLFTDAADRMISLDPGQLEMIIAEIEASTEVGGARHDWLVEFSIKMLANLYPRDALALLTKPSELIKDGSIDVIISSSLKSWAKEDSMAALDWLRKNGDQFSAQIHDDTKLALIEGTATGDPKTVFKLIGELAAKSDEAIPRIISAAKTNEERTAILAALRSYLDIMRSSDVGNEMGDSELRKIYDNWPEADMAGSEAFAKDYGIK